MSKTKTYRLDKITPGSLVTLQFDSCDDFFENAFFLGIEGEGKDRVAKLVQRDCVTGRCYEWEAYRFEGRWAYGTSAGRLRVISIDGVL